MNGPENAKLIRFLSDFTLGFSDGLTVPFALTAGLSSLGKAETVIYAGLAELCAGSISMGISGYLSALDELPLLPYPRDHHMQMCKCILRDNYMQELLPSPHSRQSFDAENLYHYEQKCNEALLREILEPLALSDSIIYGIFSEVNSQHGSLIGALQRMQYRQQRQNDFCRPKLRIRQLSFPPVASGLFISFGYLVGGAIPLCPYFFTATVGTGLRWSIALCCLSLLAFGYAKSWIMQGNEKNWKAAVREACQMLILGGLAAGAAVVCVQMLDGVASDQEAV